MAISALIFDVDGTLVDTNRQHAEAWRRALESEGFTVPIDRILPEIGKGGDKLVPALVGDEANRARGDRMRERSVKEYLQIAESESFRLFDGVEELFDRLREQGITIALATSGKEEHLRATMNSIGVDLVGLVDVLITADDAEATKPDPDLILAALEKLDLSPAQCAMVGDTPHDAEACRRAGVACLGLASGGHSAEEMMSAGSRGVWNDIGDLLEHLDEALEIASPGKGNLTWELLQRLMREAMRIAREGMINGEEPIGCIVARGDGTIIASGHNEVVERKSRLAHAEIVALERVPGQALEARDLVLVSTREPCVMCTGAAMEGAVDTIVFALAAPADSGTLRVRSPASPHSQMPRIVGGVLEEEVRAMGNGKRGAGSG